MTIYRCPGCADTSVAPTNCERCSRPMLADGAPLPLVKPANQVPWRATMAAIGLVVGLLVGVALPWLFRRGPLLGIEVVGYASAYGGAFVGLLVGALVGAIVRRRAVALDRARGRRIAHDATTIAGAADGVVQVRGVVRVVEPVQSLIDGVPCAAYVCRSPRVTYMQSGRRTESEDQFETDSAVGALEIHDDSGAIAVLPAGACDVLASLTGSSGEARIADGARVVVRGVGQWQATGPSGAGYRAVERRLVIRGNEATPRVLALDEAAREGGTGVRVDATSAAATGRVVDEVEVARAAGERAARG